MHSVVDVVQESFMITAFVFVMMVVVEYLNVLSRGAWQERLGERRWMQYFLAALLGATPGCLGAYAVVAMFTRRTVTVGAVAAAMVATCGDEAFVLIARLPGQAVPIILSLFVLGVLTGAATDLVFGRRFIGKGEACDHGAFHADEEECRHFSRERILAQWRNCTPARGILSVVLVLFLFALLTGLVELHNHGDQGDHGGETMDWICATMAAVSLLGLFVVTTVPDHFLEEHLWNHIARRHAPRIFLWTLLALGVVGLLLHGLESGVDVEEAVRESGWIWLALLAACLMGLIPTSGPHLVFVILYAEGAVPLSVLLASSIVQDGHGMLPLLAHSRRNFFFVKAINFFLGLAVGALLLALGR